MNYRTNLIKNSSQVLANIQAVETLRLSDALNYPNNASIYLERMQKTILKKGYII